MSNYDVWLYDQLEPGDDKPRPIKPEKKESSLTWSSRYLEMFPDANEREGYLKNNSSTFIKN